MTPQQEAAMRQALEALEDTLSGDLTPYQAARTKRPCGHRHGRPADHLGGWPTETEMELIC